MIDFRYHLVSIIAVFLALAVGLLVGSTALSGIAVETLTAAEHIAQQRNATLTKERTDLNNQLSADEAFAGAAASQLLQGQLTGTKVVVVDAPGYDPAVTSGVITALKRAGATVTGQIIIDPSFLTTDGQNEDQLTQLAQSTAGKAGVTLPAQASGPVAGQQAAARVLAASLLTGRGSVLSSADSAAILGQFSQGGYVSVVNGAAPPQQATLAVLVAPGGPAPQTGSQVLVALAVALRNAGSGTVMVGSVQSIGAGSVISAEDTAKQVSTVDDADTETGQIMTVWALHLLLEDKAPDQYGIGPNAAPSPAPSPSPSGAQVTTSSAPTTSGGRK